jgi:hypothetical protein
MFEKNRDFSEKRESHSKVPASKLSAKSKALKEKLSRSDRVGTRKKDIVGGQEGNWMKVMKGDR